MEQGGKKWLWGITHSTVPTCSLLLSQYIIIRLGLTKNTNVPMSSGTWKKKNTKHKKWWRLSLCELTITLIPTGKRCSTKEVQVHVTVRDIPIISEAKNDILGLSDSRASRINGKCISFGFELRVCDGTIACCTVHAANDKPNKLG